MTKKEYILKLLEIVDLNVLPIAWDLAFLIKDNAISDEIVDTLIMIFQNAMKATEDEVKKTKISKWVEFLNKLKERETQENALDQKDIESLDQLLQQI